MGTCAILSEPIFSPAPPARELTPPGPLSQRPPISRARGELLEESVILPFHPASSRRRHVPSMDLDRHSDEELIELARRAAPGASDLYLSALYRRYQPKVAAWCLRICSDREEAADVAQEVFLRVHQRLDSFRGDSRFSTWLYTVTRSVAINRGVAARRRQTEALDDESVPEPVEPSAGAEQELERKEILAAFREAMERDLEPLEARVLYLHFVDGMPLAAITGLFFLGEFHEPPQSPASIPHFEPESPAHGEILLEGLAQRVHRCPPGQGCANARNPSRSTLA